MPEYTIVSILVSHTAIHQRPDMPPQKITIAPDRVLSRLRRYLSPLEMASFASINHATKRAISTWIVSSSKQSLMPPPSTPTNGSARPVESRSHLGAAVLKERVSADGVRSATTAERMKADELSVAEALRQSMDSDVAGAEPAHTHVLQRLQRLVDYVCSDSLSVAGVQVQHPLVVEMQKELEHCFKACGGPESRHSLILKETVRQICDVRNTNIFDIDAEADSITLPAAFYTMRSGIFLPDSKRGMHDERTYSVAAAREVNVFSQLGTPFDPTPLALVSDEAAYIARPYGSGLKSKVRPPKEMVGDRPLIELVHTRPAPRETICTSTIVPASKKLIPFAQAHLDDPTTDEAKTFALPMAVYPLEWLSVTTVASDNPSIEQHPVLAEPTASQAAEMPPPASISVMLDPFRGRKPVAMHLYNIKKRGILDNYPAVAVTTVRMPPKELVPIAKIRKSFQKAVDAGLRYASELWTDAASFDDDSYSTQSGLMPYYAFVGLRLGYEDENSATDEKDLVIESRAKMGHFLAPSVSNIITSFAGDDLVYNVGRLHLETLAHTPCSKSVFVGGRYLPGSIDGTLAARKSGCDDYSNLHDSCHYAIEYLNMVKAFFKKATDNAAKALAYEFRATGDGPVGELPRVPIVEDFERVCNEIVPFIRGHPCDVVVPKAAAMPPPAAPSSKRKRQEPGQSRSRKKQRVEEEELAECDRQIDHIKKRKRSPSPPPPPQRPAPPPRRRRRVSVGDSVDDLAEEDRGKYCSSEGYDDRFNDIKYSAIPVPLPLRLKDIRDFDPDNPPTVGKFTVCGAQKMRRFVSKLGINVKILREGRTKKIEMDRKELIAAYIKWVCNQEEDHIRGDDSDFGGNAETYTEIAAEMERRVERAQKEYRDIALSREDEQLPEEVSDERSTSKKKKKNSKYYSKSDLEGESEEDEEDEEEDDGGLSGLE